MKRLPLEQSLRALAVPAPDAATRDRALHRAQIVLGQPEPATSRSAVPAPWWLAPTAATALGLLAIAALWTSRLASSDGSPEAQARVLGQFEQAFPGQLDAVIEQDGNVSVELAPQRQPASDQPLLVTFRRGNDIVRVLSYSGRQICLRLSGRPVCFEALLTRNGEVILSGEDFIWSSADHRAGVAGFHVIATPLRHSS